MNTESEIYIEYIEFEVSTGCKPVTQRFSVHSLLFIAEIKPEDPERQVKGDIFHHKNTDTRRKCKACLHIGGISVFRFSAIRTSEIAVA